MSYNQGYAQNNSQGYGQYNPYNQRDDEPQGGYNTYQQGYPQGNQYAQQDGYNQQRPAYQQQSSSRYGDERTQGGYEMGVVGNNPNRILNSIREINTAIASLHDKRAGLEKLQDRSLNAVDSNEAETMQKKVKAETDEIVNSYRNLIARVKKLKQDPESSSSLTSSQLITTQVKLKNELDKLRQLEVTYRQEHRKQIGRQMLVANPNATQEEIYAAQESGETQIFTNALHQSDRRGDAQAAARQVKVRHDAIAKLERDILELFQMFADLEAAVIQQEPQVAAIEDKAEVAEEHVTQGTVQLDGAIVKAKAARRKKWICFWIVVLIIIIVIAVAVGVVEANKKT